MDGDERAAEQSHSLYGANLFMWKASDEVYFHIFDPQKNYESENLADVFYS